MNESADNKKIIEVYGVGLVKIKGEADSEREEEILYYKGVDINTIKKILDSYGNEIVEKRQGKSFFPFEEFTSFINYFNINQNEIIVIIYIDDKENPHSFPQLYMHSRTIMKAFKQDKNLEEIIELWRNSISIPKAEGIIGVFFVDSSGTPLFTKIMGKKSNIIKSEVQISGFISALFSFSKFIIKEDSGSKLKEVNFGKQLFYTVLKENIIFAFLVDEMTPLLKRYIYIISNEFLSRYRKILDNFDGEVAQFYEFENVIDEYLVI